MDLRCRACLDNGQMKRFFLECKIVSQASLMNDPLPCAYPCFCIVSIADEMYLLYEEICSSRAAFFSEV
jgi:hypothetical protein